MVSLELPSRSWKLLSVEESVLLTQWLTAITLFWTVSFLIFRFGLARQRSYEFSNRLVSVLHVAVAVPLCTRALVENVAQLLPSVGGPNTSAQVLAMVASSSYFIYDFFGCLFDPKVDYTMLVHHLCTLLGLSYGLVLGKCGTELVACLWLMELSNPCMHMRFLLRDFGMRDSQIATVNDALFALTFTVARMMVGPILVWATLRASSPFAVKVGAVGIQLISLFWFFKILNVLYFKLFRKGSSKKEN